MDLWNLPRELTPEKIGKPTRCPFCPRAGIIDDIRGDLGIVIRHDATTWHVVDVVTASSLRWDAFFTPPFDTTRLRKAIAEKAASKKSG